MLCKKENLGEPPTGRAGAPCALAPAHWGPPTLPHRQASSTAAWHWGIGSWCSDDAYEMKTIFLYFESSEPTPGRRGTPARPPPPASPTWPCCSAHRSATCAGVFLWVVAICSSTGCSNTGFHVPCGAGKAGKGCGYRSARLPVFVGGGGGGGGVTCVCWGWGGVWWVGAVAPTLALLQAPAAPAIRLWRQARRDARPDVRTCVCISHCPPKEE